MSSWQAQANYQVPAWYYSGYKSGKIPQLLKWVFQVLADPEEWDGMQDPQNRVQLSGISG
jgi:hypothetical protein